MLWKTTFREIKHTLGRYLAILAIVALGVGFYAGLKLTRPVMVATVQDFLEKQNFYDYRLISTLGFEKKDVEAFLELPDVCRAVGAVSVDVLYEAGENESVIRLHTITEGINDCYLVAGRMPKEPGECLVDSRLMTEADMGSEIVIAGDNDEGTLDMLLYKSYRVVGIVQNPLYLNYERGTSSIGSGQLSGYAFIPEESVDTDYYTEIYINFDQDYEIYSEAYDTFIEAHKEAVEHVVAERVDIRYASVMDEANDALAEGEEKLSDAKTELADGEKKLNDAKEDLAEGEEKLSNAKKELADGKKEIRDAKKEAADGETELEKQKKAAEAEFKRAKEKIAAAKKEIKKQEQTVNDGAKKIEAAEQELDTNEAALVEQKQTLEQQKAQLEAALAAIANQRESLGSQLIYYEEALNQQEKELKASLAQVEQGLEAVKEGMSQITAARKELNGKKKKLTEGKKELAAAKKQLKAAQKEYDENYAAYKEQTAAAEAALADARQKIKDGEAKLNKGEREIADGEIELEDGRQEILDAEQELVEGKDKIADADAELADAKQEIADIPAPDYYMLGRGDNIGFACFESDSMIVDNIAGVFPVFFFLVALLVCITTMNRMVDEQRTQIGVLKALGYSKASIMGEYIFYAGSSAFVGGLLGFLIGSTVFPYIIWNAYGIMYEVCGIHLVFDGAMLLFSIAAALLCSVGATVFSCYVECVSVPASLMRPKAPKSGKRIFLEYITPLWNRLSFLKKVSARNVLRYKKRFFMMVLGISGCTALLLTGYGIKDSIVNIAENQYDKIQTYDLEVILTDPVAEEDMDEFREGFQNMVEEDMFLCQETVDVINGKALKQANLIVPEDEETVNNFWHLFSADGQKLAYPSFGEAVVNKKLADKCNLKVGDSVTVRDGDMKSFTVTITGIAENYVYNYIYISRKTYQQGIGSEPEYKRLCVKTVDTQDIHKIAAAYTENDEVLQVTVTEDLRTRINNMMGSLDAVVLLVIFCAGALAFIVLYNLTNINITERIREIATIKVLGFYAGETAQYVFRENMLLTAIGTAVGLLIGKWLHHFVISSIDIDLISFDIHIKAGSYIMSILLTFVFALLVDAVMYAKLGNINMAESLKSIE